jgi:large-conductance mechanosensitive channel
VAFGKIITSLVNDIIMPVVGLLLGKLKAVRCPNCTSQIEEAANS